MGLVEPGVRYLGSYPVADPEPQKVGRCWVGHGVVSALRGWLQVDPDAPEAGGVLLGDRVGPEPLSWVVRGCTVPGPGDVRTRHTWTRLCLSHTRAQQEAVSGGYLGEWHTHAEDHPSPGVTDLAAWRACTREASRQIGAPTPTLHLIAGLRSVGVWEVTP